MHRIAITALATLCLAACNQPSSTPASQAAAEDAIAESAAGNETEGEPAQSEVRTESHGELITQVEGGLTATRAADGGAMPLPDDFPDDVYLPDDYALMTTTESDQGIGWYFKTNGDIDAIFTTARQGMQEMGWTVTHTERSPYYINFKKDKNTGRLVMTLDDEDDEKAVFYIVSLDKPCPVGTYTFISGMVTRCFSPEEKQRFEAQLGQTLESLR